MIYRVKQHWPPSYPSLSKKGRLIPRDLLSVWPASIHSSCIPNLQPTPRPTKRTSFVICNIYTARSVGRIQKPKSNVPINNIKEHFTNFCCPVTCYESNQAVSIQPWDLSEGVASFLLQIYETVHFQAFHVVTKRLHYVLQKVE